MRTLLAALVVVAAAGAAAEDKPKGDLEKFQGKWKAQGGPNKDYTVVMEVKGSDIDSVITTPEGREFRLKGRVKLDDSTKPKQLDWVGFARPDGTEVDPNLAIYELDGDALKVCQGGPGRPRPTEFKAGDGGPPTILEFKRQKDDKPADDAKPKGDLAKFQGKWTSALGPNRDRPVTVAIDDRKVTATFTDEQGERRILKGELTLDEATAPKQVDWLKFTARDGTALDPIRGIYRLDDGELTVCNGGPGEPRPTEFKSGDGGPPHLMTLRRESPAAK